jgi:tryptophan synthase alpha chain
VTSSLIEVPVPVAPSEPGPFETALRHARDAGRKLLVPYLTGGLGTDWIQCVRAAAAAGADAIEIGIPFSDPVMDGPTIQLASQRALDGGANPDSILDELRRADVGIPLAVMTYANIAFHYGWSGFAQRLADSGISAAILPDVPLEESGPWCQAADAAGIETVMLAAPTGGDPRLLRITARARGFVYGVGLLGVTGVRAELAASALSIARRLKAITDTPVLVGVGISTPAQAVEVCRIADGVVVGSAVVQRVVDGDGPEGVHELVAQFRAALDATAAPTPTRVL